MIPILYQTVTEGTVPTDYGLGALTDCIRCEVKEERNGAYELELDYAAEGIHAEEIAVNRIIKAKPNFTDDPQLFRIYKVGKTINGRFTVSAQHISYDLSGKLIQSGTAGSCGGAVALLAASAGNFAINTNKSINAPFTIKEPSSVRSWFGGKEGSLLDIYGGEWSYNNYSAYLRQDRGADRGVQIRYGKNLTQLSQVLNMENLVTCVLPYYIDQDGNKTIGTKVATGLTLDVDRDIAVDFSQQVNPDSGTAIATQLANLATSYIASHNLTAPLNSITLDFVQLSSLQERVDLCDTVHIIVESLGINAAIKCVATVWDVLKGRYISSTFGEAQSNIADTIAESQKELAKTPSVSFMSQAITRATELITGNMGGYVILHDSDGNGQPDEILIMDTADIATATKVWRWNKNGLGYSSTGYAGTYGLAMTADGEIVADFIKTGTLSANLIKAGVIEDVAHNSTIDMSNGEATLKNLQAKNRFELIDTDGIRRCWLTYSTAGGTTLEHLDSNGTPQAQYAANPNYGGVLDIFNLAGTQVARLSVDQVLQNGLLDIWNAAGEKVAELATNTTDGGLLAINSSNGTKVARLFTGASDDGSLNLYDSTESNTINLSGQTGVVTCVSVNQTSSRKVKENIKPIEDASKILELDAVSFDFKNKARGTNRRGFIAEDVAKVLPNLVTPETEEVPASLNYVEMIPYLQAVIKEQEARIKALEEKINNIGG